MESPHESTTDIGLMAEQQQIAEKRSQDLWAEGRNTPRQGYLTRPVPPERASKGGVRRTQAANSTPQLHKSYVGWAFLPVYRKLELLLARCCLTSRSVNFTDHGWLVA